MCPRGQMKKKYILNSTKLSENNGREGEDKKNGFLFGLGMFRIETRW